MYAVIHPPNFAAQAAVHGRPELQKQPFVVIDGESPNETVFAANRAARLAGIEVGMTRLQAESFSAVLSMRRVLEREATAHALLHAVACMFSPRIEHVDHHPGIYVLDVRGMGRLFGDAAALAHKVRHSVTAAGFVSNIAIAENFHAAVCLAWGRTGVCVVPPGKEAEYLATLPVLFLNLSHDHASTFESWGIHTCGELAALPETELVSRIGQSGKRLHALARGTWPHLMIPVEPSFEEGLVERQELDFPIELLEPLSFLLSRMTDALLDRVKERARAIAMLRLVLNLDDGAHHERIVRPALPLQDRATLLKLLQLDLEAHPPGSAVLSLELHAQSAAPYRAQHGLFLPQSPEPGRLEVLLARLRKLLGQDRVGSPELLDDNRGIFRVVPFVPPPPAKGTNPASTTAALRVCRPPQAIGVLLNGKAPSRIYWEGAKYTVRELAGPWRMSGQWWNDENWCREEWDVRLAADRTECVCRIAFDPDKQRWYMQGTYD